MSVIGYYFGWPHGAVWSNLVASAVCVGGAWWRIRARQIAHHAAVLAQAERHHQALRQHLATELTAHHARMTAIIAAPPAPGTAAGKRP